MQCLMNIVVWYVRPELVAFVIFYKFCNHLFQSGCRNCDENWKAEKMLDLGNITVFQRFFSHKVYMWYVVNVHSW